MQGVMTTQREWEELAQLDPLWAILTEKSKKFGKWNVADFFDSGQAEIDRVMTTCGFRPGGDGRALDFGSGAGRLTKALSRYFGEAYGVDISEKMIELARRYAPECTFLVNSRDNLRLFPDDFFDFVYSGRVLQHQQREDVVKLYIEEFVRVVKPGGVVMFQIPYKLGFRYWAQPHRRVYSLLRAFGFSPEFLYHRLFLNPMRTISLPLRDVRAAVSAAGARIVRQLPDDFNVHSMSYLVTKHKSIDPIVMNGNSLPLGT